MKTSLENPTATPLLSLKPPAERLLAAYCALSLFAILYIPYFFPVLPSTSDSYIFGYSNRIGILLLFLFAFIGAIWTRGLRLDPASTPRPSAAIPRKYLWLSLSIELAACLAMYRSALRSGPAAEGEQQIHRIWLLSLGKKPYIDFDWPWGPSFLYIPVWIAHLFHLTIVQGYFLFWTLCSLTGVLLLYTTINWINFPSAKKTAIFLLFLPCIVLSVLNMGTNYTWVRYLFPLVFLLLIYKIITKPSHAIANQIRACSLAVLFTGILALISPEVTISHAFACMVLLYPRKASISRPSQFAVYLAFLLGIAIIFAAAFKTHMLDALINDGSGGNSFPILLAPATLFFFAALFIGACYLVQRAHNPELRDNTITLILFSIPMTTAALGRCDPTHVLLNGIGFFLALLLYASSSTRFWRLARNAFVICFLVLANLSLVLSWLFLFNKPAPPPFPANADVAALYPRQASPDGFFEAPFGYTPGGGFFYSPQIDYGFYDGLVRASMADAYRVKISELAQHPQRPLLLQQGIFTAACEVHGDINSAFISILFTTLYTARPVHTDSVRKPLCDYIQQHYILAVPATPQNFQYELWTPKS